MTSPVPDVHAKQISQGGSIPGLTDAAAFTLSTAEPSVLPLLIAVPHAGRAYPDGLLSRMRHAASSTMRLEDRYADLLGEAVAAETGANLLIAHAPRAMIDLNRAEDEVDWEMIALPGGTRRKTGSLGLRARSGLGLIPRRLPGLGELWRHRHEEVELEARIDAIHQPYHNCIEQQLNALRDRWGAALLVDLHSMPPLGLRGAHPPSEFVIGDRFGATCHGSIIAGTFAHLAEHRRAASHNRPYAGGYVLERHARPHEGIHALQLEIDRSSYLDQRMVEKGAGFADMVELLCGLIRRLASEVAQLGRERGGNRWAVAAE